MWTDGWRPRFREAVAPGVDVLVVGGGITGAGVALEAARAGLVVALVEQSDFASGTSSWSSKLVHGGLRYLASGDWRLTRESVRERQRLLREVPGLVEPLDFVVPLYRGQRPGRAALAAALAVYDLMAGKRYSRHMDRADITAQLPYLRGDGLVSGYRYRDALTDDARLTLRVLGQAREHGALAANYMRVDRLMFDNARVAGAYLDDRVAGQALAVRARCVVNATGPWSDRLRGAVDDRPRLRPLRGSHFVFPFHALPVVRAVTLFHPDDRRPLFAIPWQGATVFGTTDVDHDQAWEQAPRMSRAESDYLIAAARHYFPALDLGADKAISAFAGVRPVVAGHPGASASAQSRESAIDTECGLVSVIGGKLTTFRVTARHVLAHIGRLLGRELDTDGRGPVMGATRHGRRRDAALVSRYGLAYAHMPARADDDARFGDTHYRLRELRYALAHEAVEHLDDLLMRRTRAGLLLADGGARDLAQIRALCQKLLGWDDARWGHETERYLAHWRAVHAPAGRARQQ